MTTTMKAPLALQTVEPATRLGSSQYRVMLSLGRKSCPVTVIPTLGPPAAGSSPIVAKTGVGVGGGGACGVAETVAAGPGPAVLVAVTLNVYAVPLVREVTVMLVVAASAVS